MPYDTIINFSADLIDSKIMEMWKEAKRGNRFCNRSLDVELPGSVTKKAASYLPCRLSGLIQGQ